MVALNTLATATKIVDNYPQLRAYRGLARTVIVSHADQYGFFARVATGTENGGTLIVDASGRKWKRIYEGPILPEWWEKGTGPQTLSGFTIQTGYDTNGDYLDNLVAREGIKTDRDQIQAAVNVAGAGKVQLRAEKTYTVDSPVSITLPVELIMNGATITRSNQLAATTITATASVSDLTITVNDASVFRQGDIISVVSGSGDAGQSGYHTVGGVNTTTNVVSFTPAIAYAQTSGTRVYKVHPFLLITSGRDVTARVHGGTFDGNSAGNANINYWTQCYSIVHGQARSHIYDCTFKNSCVETIAVDRGVVEKCLFIDTGGSGTHIASGGGPYPTLEQGLTIRDCEYRNTNTKGNLLTLHSEGAITFSAAVKNLLIDNVRMRDINAYCVAESSLEDSNVTIRGMDAENALGIFAMSSATTNDYQRTFRILDSRFKNCGDMWLQGTSAPGISKGYGVDGVTIDNVEIINGRIHLRQCSGVSVDNLELRTDSADPAYPDWAASLLVGSAMFMAYNCDRVNISRSRIVGPVVAKGSVISGLVIYCDRFRKTAAGATTTTFYTQDVRITDVDIVGFPKGLHSTITGFPTDGTVLGVCSNWIYKNVSVWANADYTFGQIGIEAWPGVIVDSCNVYWRSGVTNGVGILARGIDVSLGVTKYVGAVVVNCFLPYSKNNKAIQIGSTTAAGNRYNCIVRGNRYTGTIDNKDPTQHEASDNVDLATVLTSLTAAERPYQAESRQDSGVY